MSGIIRKPSLRLRLRAAVPILACLSLSACGSMQIVDRISLAQTGAYDLDGKRVKTVVLIGEYKEKDKANVRQLETESNSDFDMLPRLQTKTDKYLQYGQLKMVVFGDEYAKKGLAPVLDSFWRDAKFSSLIQLGISGTDVSKLLASTVKSGSPSFLRNLVVQNMKYGNLPESNFHDYMFDYYGAGRDLFLPHLALSGDAAKVDGLALFKEDKLVANIDIGETFYLKLLTENTRNGSVLVPIASPQSDASDFALLRSAGSRVRYRAVSKGSDLSVEIRVRMKGILAQMPESTFPKSKKAFEEIETETEKYFKERGEAFIAFCQAKGTDPFGFGDFFRSVTKNWDEQEFERSYGTMKATVKVELDIMQS